MNTRRRFIASLASAGLAAGCPTLLSAQNSESTWKRIQRTRTLRIGAVAGSAPYYQRNLASRQWEGFMIDFAHDLAKSLGVRLDIRETTWGNFVLDLQANKIDVFLGANPSPQRARAIAFSDPLFNNAFVGLARQGFRFRTWQDLNRPDVRIAVDLGSSHDQIVTRMAPKARISRLASLGEATMAVQSGRADVQILVVVLALTMVSRNPAIGHLVQPTPVQTTTTNLGLRKESDPSWRNYANQWIARERASGRVKATVLGNLQKLARVDPRQIPPEISF